MKKNGVGKVSEFRSTDQDLVDLVVYRAPVSTMRGPWKRLTNSSFFSYIFIFQKSVNMVISKLVVRKRLGQPKEIRKN